VLTVVEKVILLRGVDIFSEVPTSDLSLLAAVAEEVTVSADQPIYAEKDPSDSMYVVIEGGVRLHRDGRVVHLAGPNEAFGTWALFDDEPRVTSASASADGRLLRIDKEAFVDLLADNVQITQGVLKAVVGRLRRILARMGEETGPRGETS
jgi:CRP/FNR family transcriptional regulator, cyclic AMP receptor protein